MGSVIRMTRSVCPVCLKNIPAQLVRGEDGSIFLKKSCPAHGSFCVPVWRGALNFEDWTLGAEPLSEGGGLCCPGNCGICGEHASDTCCILLEVTKRCNLHCRFCFANGGAAQEDPSTEELKASIRKIVQSCGAPLLQFSGGEPTLREDLPELVRFAKEAGCSHTQINTNGIRLAEDPAYAARLAQAGLDIVFLQFDGTRDEIFEALRGRPLLQTKRTAIRVCADLGLGVTLVPTVVPGVNETDLGNIVQLAAGLAPGVRGVHFQPVSYFGRFPRGIAAEESARGTLDQLMSELAAQTGIPVDSFLPSRCDHPLCGFHARFLIGPEGDLTPLTSFTHAARAGGSAKANREYIARHWSRTGTEESPETPGRQSGSLSDSMDFDTFLYRLRHGSLTLTAMAFQDAMNLNIERLCRCSLHVFDSGKIKPFCAAYLSGFDEGTL